MMIQTIGAILTALLVAVVSGIILDWWSGWRGKTWLYPKLRRAFRKLGIRRKSKGLLIFVSAGGTCRDPMAKVIAEKLIGQRAPELAGLQIEGRAIMSSPSSNQASHAARVAIRELYGEDLLEDYSPARLDSDDIARADLILVMAEDLIHKNTLPADKTNLFKEFFGAGGDVTDPWPDGRDEETLARYRATAEEMKEVMEAGLERLVVSLRRS